MSSRTMILAAASVTLSLFSAACTDDAPSAPTLATAPAPLAARTAPHDRTTASAEWSAVARDLVRTQQSNAFQGIRNYATLNLAQYNAVVAAARASHGGHRVSQRAAAAAASVVALTYAYPSAAAALE